MGSKINFEEDVLKSGDDRSESRVDLNHLMRKVKEEEKRSKRQNIAISAAALSAVAVFGIILTL
tara:strand:+ start:257 stop:448 length:192 start_codon:yes stop_codon:yes gene_type:complete